MDFLRFRGTNFEGPHGFQGAREWHDHKIVGNNGAKGRSVAGNTGTRAVILF